MITHSNNDAWDELQGDALEFAGPRLVRPITQWVEEELVLPSGPYKGQRYKHRRHPASRLWFEAIDSGNWNRFAATGPTQNGKTLMCYVAPVMYHLFELKETVIIGLPTMQMAQDKWQEDLLPAIAAGNYSHLLPKSGEGSRGGNVKRAIAFSNGVSLRFMSGGGGDKQRAGYTSRVLAVTETDGMDEAGGASRESDKIEQLEGRTRAFGPDKRIYLECTASVEHGRIWTEITSGTNSRIVRPCPKCGKHVSPERDDLQGWQDAVSEQEAADKAHFTCPACHKAWTDSERYAAAEKAVLLHDGQKVNKKGKVSGPLPPTSTLGFRWSAIDNPFAPASMLGAEEWRARRHHDQDNAEKKQCQFVWSLPWSAPEVELTPLSAEDVEKRVVTTKKGMVPMGTVGITCGIDTGKQKLHWQAIAFQQSGSGTVIDYGEQPTKANDIGTQRGLVQALTRLYEYFAAGWQDDRGGMWSPLQVWIDSGWHEHKQAVYEFCKARNAGQEPGRDRYRPAKGFGERQRGTSRYSAPQLKTDTVRYIGQQYDMRMQRHDKILLTHVNADHWKSQLHQRMAMEPDEAGAIVLYQGASPDEHLEYSRQITAEVQKSEFMAGRGEVIVWDRIRRQNHYLDAGYLALAAGDFMLAELERLQDKHGDLDGGWMAAQARGSKRRRQMA